jgi:hypothetical protein
MFTLKIKTGGSAFQDESTNDLDPTGYEVRRLM